MGNSWLIDLPPGSLVTINEEASENQLKAVAINEMEEGHIVKQDVILCSKAYILERDERELDLMKRIDELSLKEH